MDLRARRTRRYAPRIACSIHLPDDERMAFSLRFISEMQLTEVAAACRVSLATVKRRLARAESRFVDAAKDHPALRERLQNGGRWGVDES